MRTRKQDLPVTFYQNPVIDEFGLSENENIGPAEALQELSVFVDTTEGIALVGTYKTVLRLTLNTTNSLHRAFIKVGQIHILLVW